MLRLVKGMVAETNDVWYWNHPNIDYWVSQQSLVYIKHSPVTGWPAGVILIIRQRNMAPLSTAGPWNTASSMLSSSSSPGVLAHVFIPNESTFYVFLQNCKARVAEVWMQDHFRVSIRPVWSVNTDLFSCTQWINHVLTYTRRRRREIHHPLTRIAGAVK